MPAAPKPLEWYQKPRIDPRNADRLAALEARLKEMQPLSKRERRRLEWRSKVMLFGLRLRRWNQKKQAQRGLIRQLEAVRDEAQDLYDLRIAALSAFLSYLPHVDLTLPVALIMVWHVEHYNAERDRLKARGVRLKRELDKWDQRIERLQPRFDRWRAVYDRLTMDDQHKRLSAERQTTRRQYEDEAKITARIIRQTWGNLSGCHYVAKDKDGKEKIITPGFDRVWIQSHSITYRVKTSINGLFGFKTTLPYKVLLKNLYAPETLENIAGAVDRQVTAQWNRTKTRLLIRVSRIDAPSGIPDMVPYAKMLESYPFNDHRMCPFPVGVDENNTAIWNDLHNAPFILIGGATRSGKSNKLRELLLTWFTTQTPDDIRFILFDMKKGVEFGLLRHVPHVIGSFCRDTDEVLPRLQQIVALMNRRFEMLEQTGTVNILEYNDLVGETAKWSRIVVVIDEMIPLSTLKSLTKAIYNELALIGAQGAAVGINAVLCTQYPIKQVIRSEIKAQFVARFGFKTASGPDSMVMLRNHDAFNLPMIKGRCAYQFDPAPIQIQTSFMPQEVLSPYLRKVYAAWGNKPLPFPEIDLLGEPAVIVKPQKTTPAFTRGDWIRVAIEEMDGLLSPKNTVKYLGSDAPPLSRLDTWLQEVKSEKTVNHAGKTFAIGRGDKKTYVLQEISEKPNDSIPTMLALAGD